MASVCAPFRVQTRLRLPLTCASGSTCHEWVNDNTWLDNIRSSMGKIKERHTHRCEFENQQRPLCANRVNSHFCWLNNRAFKLNRQQIQSSKKQFISASILCYFVAETMFRLIARGLARSVVAPARGASRRAGGLAVTTTSSRPILCADINASKHSGRLHSSTAADPNLPSLLTITNGEKVKPTFSKAELESRLSKLRTYMENNSIGGALFTSYHSINYYSDFLYLAFGRPYGLVVTPEKVVIIAALIDYGQPTRRNQCGDTVIYTDWQSGNYWRAVEQELGHVKGKVGCEFDHIPLQDFKNFQNAVPGAQVIDIAEPSMFMRMIKSPEEIALIREGARVGDIGGDVGRAALAAGVPEYEVAMAAQGEMVREIAKTYPHTELRDTWSWVQGGINTDGAHNSVTTRPFVSGDIVSLNMFPMISGYYTALERTMFLDHATDEQLRLWEVNCEVHRRGMELIKPGVKCKDVTLELNEIYRKYDLLKYRTFGYGHSFGIMCHYYGREAGLEFREDIETVLEPNMVVSMEPMITIPEGQPGAGGYREHNILVVNETGAENITHFPFGPEHNIVKN